MHPSTNHDLWVINPTPYRYTADGTKPHVLLGLL